MPSPFPGMDPYLEGALWTTDLLGYDLEINYTRSPEPALDDQSISIADSLLRTAGLRPA
jgi:hypothetical protein